MATIELVLGDRKWRLEDNASVTIGRTGYDCSIEIDDQEISRRHAQVSYFNGHVFVKDLNSTAGTTVHGKKIQSDTNVRLSIDEGFELINHQFRIREEGSPDQTSRTGKPIDLQSTLNAKGQLKIGHRPDNDIVILDPTVSREHALIHYQNGQYWLEDLHSLNGTFLNGRKIPSGKKISIQLEDEIIISLTSLNLIDGVSHHEREEVAIAARNISKIFQSKDPQKPGKGLQPLSVDIKSGDFVALMGPSGCGKSTLLRCLNNDNPPNTGEVWIKGITISKAGERTRSYHSIKKKIGYVPQDDIIHRDLTVEQTLRFAARLRLPDDTVSEEIDRKINQVLHDVSLDQSFKDKLVGKLSGGQRKRVCIAVEMLTEPTILFLDEPTSPLDPESIDSFLKSIQKLASKGTTIVMVTHKPDDLNYADKAIFLMSSGHLCFYGKPGELKDQFGANTFAEVYSEVSLEDPDAHPEQQRAAIEAANQQKVNDYYIAPGAARTNNSKPIKKEINTNEHSAVRQLFWLLTRYAKIKMTDQKNLLLLIAQPVIIAILICIIFQELQMGVLFFTSISAIWFGVSNSAKEIVGELPIFRRERMFNVRMHTYILSKWIVLSAIALLQSLLFIPILYLKFHYFPMEGYEDILLHSLGSHIFFMFLIAASATLIGLLLSARARTTEQVMTIVPIVLMPQIMLAGMITKIDNTFIEIMSFCTLGRWGTEVLGRVQDAAAGDPTGVESLLDKKPSLSDPGTLELFRSNAYNRLSLYDPKVEELVGGAFDSMQANVLWMLGLSLVMYLMIYGSLKKR